MCGGASSVAAAASAPSLAVCSPSSFLPASATPLANHSGNPSFSTSPPGGSFSSSAALIVPPLSLVECVYVVNGVTSGWKTSWRKVITGGRSG